MAAKRNQQQRVRHPHQPPQIAIQAVGAAVGAVIAGKILIRITRFINGDNSSDFKFIVNLEASKILKLAEELIRRSQKVHDSVAAVPLEKVTYGNVIMQLARLEAEEFALVQSCKFPRLVSSSKEVQQASIDAENMLDAHRMKCSVRPDVYKVVKAVSQQNYTLEAEAQRYVRCLRDAEQRYVHISEFMMPCLDLNEREDTFVSFDVAHAKVRDFERQGLSLMPEVREELERLKARIAELCNVFQHNLSEDETVLCFTREELSGMHPNFIKSLHVGDAGKLTVSLKPCHYLPIMEHCKVRATRSAVATARYRRCMKENIPILEKVLDLRRKYANLLGYKSWAEYRLELRMAKCPEKVKEFHEQMLQHILPSARKELKLLQDLKEEEEGDPAFGVEDILYYMRKAERRLLNFDVNVLDQYFPVEVVTTGLLRIYGHLLGCRFQENERKIVWDEDVREFSVIDLKSKKTVGFFYLDLFSREGKYNHACVVPLQSSCDMARGKRLLPVAALLMNLTKSGPNVPSLLKHSELVAYFHEFGHVMHHIYSHATFARFSGLLVETDFLEIPSHMLENWCYEKESLKLMSGSYKDSEEGIPDSILRLLKEKRRSFLALRTLSTQLFIGILDQIIHTQDKVNIEQVVRDVFPEVVLGMSTLEGTNIVASTLHLMSGGYDADCYGRLWSEVFAADLFEAKFKGNVMNNLTGREYRDKVLAPGATKDALQILREFLGRDPSVDAYARLNCLNECDEL